MRQKTIFMGGFHLESNTSNPVPVEYEDFVISRGIDMLPCFSEATAVFREAGYSVLPSLYAESICVAGGVLSLNASINGIWLYLHGSMQVEFLGSGEAFIVSAIRERVGPSVPISIALDFHGNISLSLVRNANLITGDLTAPHVDIGATQANAAAL